MDPGIMLETLCGQLCGACVQSYNIFSDAQNFGTDFGDFCLDLVKERGRLEDWVKAWEISDGDGVFHRKLNPEDWQYRYAVGVLARICGLFANLKNLDSSYGVRVVHVHVQEEARGNHRLRMARSTKNLFKDMKNQLSFSVTHPQHTATSGSPSRTRPPSPPIPEGTPAINANIIAHLENPAKIETNALPPGLSLTDEFTRISDATAEFQKILPAYKKLQWAISDKGKFEKLIQKLTKYNDGLYQSLPLPNQLAISMESRPLSSARNKHYTVPFNSTTIFTGRSNILKEIHQHFLVRTSSDTHRKQRRYVLFGLGGSGKTQIAVKFAEDYRDSFWAILWVDATSHETAEKSFRDIARIARVEENVKAAQQWLTSLEEEWLLIIDNADDPALDISECFPTGNRGNILITTRNRDCLNHGSHHEIREMEEDEAITLLIKASKTESNEALQWAPQIVKELGFLALAIDQAGAYIANTCEIGEYLDIFKQHRKKLLLQTSAQKAMSYKWAVYTTWEVAFQSVEEENPVAADILQVFAFLHHEGISEEIFQRASIARSATEVPEKLMRILWEDSDKRWDSFRFRNNLSTLLRYSLIRREKNAYSVHPLVHSWARDRLGKQEKQLYLKLAICLLSHSITWKIKTEDYAFRRQLLPHIDASRIRSADPYFDFETDLKQVKHTAGNFGLVYSEMGRWREAEDNQVQAVKASEMIFGKEHRNTLSCLSNLALTYGNQGRLKEAEKIEERVVEARERVLGKEHPHTLTSINNLASTYKNQGRLEEAEKMEERVVEARERILGKEHPHTLNSMSNLASTYGKQGRLEEAEKMGERVVEARERILGKEHPSTLTSMAVLAWTYRNQGRLEEAKMIEENVVEVRERILGKGHPRTLQALENLASTYRSLGRLKEAKEIEVRVTEARRL